MSSSAILHLGQSGWPEKSFSIQDQLSFTITLPDKHIARHHVDHVRHCSVPAPELQPEDVIVPSSLDTLPTASTAAVDPTPTIRRSTHIRRLPER